MYRLAAGNEMRGALFKTLGAAVAAQPNGNDGYWRPIGWRGHCCAILAQIMEPCAGLGLGHFIKDGHEGSFVL